MLVMDIAMTETIMLDVVGMVAIAAVLVESISNTLGVMIVLVGTVHLQRPVTNVLMLQLEVANLLHMLVMVSVMMEIIMLDVTGMKVIAAAQMSRRHTVLNANVWTVLKVWNAQAVAQAQVVFQHTVVMDSVMMRITLVHAVGILVIAVEIMSRRHIVPTANVWIPKHKSKRTNEDESIRPDIFHNVMEAIKQFSRVTSLLVTFY